MRRALTIALFAAAAVVLPDFSAWTQNLSITNDAHYAFGEVLHVPGVPNSAKVSDHLYRGAQPRDPGLRELRKIGITTIVDLRDEDKARIVWEQKASESLGIHFVHIPVNGWGPPTDEQVAQFLSIFRQNPDEKVFVHCRFGEDRTGVFVATYRMVFDKFPTTTALQEMDRFGFNRRWHPSMSVFVREFPSHLDTSPALASFRTTP